MQFLWKKRHALSLFPHHLIRKHSPVLQGDAHRVGARWQLTHVYAFEGLALRAYQTTLQVVELHLGGLHVWRELHVQLFLHGVGIEGVRANLYATFVHAHRAVVIE